jgi:alkylation response protein AidB-like acyl-CoA dehydrogenase
MVNTGGMDFLLTDEQLALRDELRAYYADLLTPEVQQSLSDGGMGDDNWKRIVKQIAADGWLGIGWPTEYGGQNRSPIEQLIFFDETQRAEAPVPMLSINTVGPTIMAFGSDEQKDRFLPGILAGELNFAIGYTEPGSGTDLASLQTRAVRDGDEYVINGQKIYTSLAAHADYIWLAARTDPEAPKHKGISIILVPTDTPGVDIQPLDIMAIGDTTATFYDDVRVPVTNRVGEENSGWSLITSQLNYERVAICNAGMIWRYLDEVTRFARDHDDPDGGGRLIDREWVRLALARVRGNAEVLQLLNWKVAAGLTAGGLDPSVASATKVFGTEAYIETLGLLMEIVGPMSYLTKDSPGAVLRGRMERSYQGILVLTFGGGTNEIQRDIIAMLGLGMPRADR